MALPASRNTTYAAGSQVKSADLNDVQDQIIALAAAPVTVKHAAEGVAVVAGWAVGAGSAVYGVRTTTTGATWVIVVPVQTGRVLKSVTARVKPGGATNEIQVSVYVRRDEANVVTAASASTSGTGWEDVVVAGAIADHTFAAGEALLVEIQATGAGAGERLAEAVAADMDLT